ncbi:MAG: hypothetical protein PGMFKBFP_00834 [Anaerolineales bacterium]|jgi:energy-coupling factor transporter transmembrane protein EcfT|nr:hypothetical protein [Anaerolineales bacterium]OQY85351.1 MAG: hypothetical protein B6D40_03725 [Anaerolineae bacterium UTCFX3]
MLKPAQPALSTLAAAKPLLGSRGRLFIFVWALLMALLPPLEKSLLPAIIALIVLGALYPFALRRLSRPRWLALLAILFLVNLFFGAPGAEKDLLILGLPLSSLSLLSGAQMTLRAVVILLDADGLSASVDVAEVAGLLERGGLRGLGFSIGVAANLLPELRQSGVNAWHSLRMRGGLRANWRRGLQLLALTVLTNALRHSEEIVLAAEARAFRPELSRRSALRAGSLDGWIGAACLLSLAALFATVW